MKPENEKKLNDILTSWEGMQRAQPEDDLFHKIESQIFVNQKSSKQYVYWAAAAAILILIINFYAFDVQINKIQYNDTASLYENVSLYSNFKMYEE
ncbi:hypothetical protein [Membranihabitans marinus]|uniref:hypothetical protein n=1 Tax=Membranihabitans marinus TaxID=1227546 RepID=UPI001F2CB5AF|nr:hypothetical protein [Membranihabitans marinus]